MGDDNYRAPYKRMEPRNFIVATMTESSNSPVTEPAGNKARIEGEMDVATGNSNYPAILAANYIFSGALQSSLMGPVHGKEELSYGSSSSTYVPE